MNRPSAPAPEQIELENNSIMADVTDRLMRSCSQEECRCQGTGIEAALKHIDCAEHVGRGAQRSLS